MFNWSGKQALEDDEDYRPPARDSPVPNRKQVTVTGDIEAFDHTFKGEIHTISGEHDALAVFGNCAYESRGCKLICSAQSFEIIEEVTLSKVNKSNVPYRAVCIYYS